MKRAASSPLSPQRQQERHDRAFPPTPLATEPLATTPLLQVLPLVLSSGYLYSHECIQAASTCKNWFRVWDEVGERLPFDSQVQVFFKTGGRPNLPKKYKGALRTPQFVRQVFDKVNELKLMAETDDETARNNLRQNLPVWGSGIRFVYVFCGNSGVSIEYSKTDRIRQNSIFKHYPGEIVLAVKLDEELKLRGGVETLDDYDGTPLWP